MKSKKIFGQHEMKYSIRSSTPFSEIKELKRNSSYNNSYSNLKHKLGKSENLISFVTRDTPKIFQNANTRQNPYVDQF